MGISELNRPRGIRQAPLPFLWKRFSVLQLLGSSAASFLPAGASLLAELPVLSMMALRSACTVAMLLNAPC